MYDCVVLGLGGVGSATLLSLAQRGHRVLGLDRFPAAHDRGSSHGKTRVIRQVYFEHPDYVPLLRRSYELWNEIDARATASIWEQTGLVQIGPPDGDVIQGVLKSAAIHDISVELLDPRQHAQRFPYLGQPPDMMSVYEPTGGVLQVEECIREMLSQAEACQAEARHDVTVEKVERSKSGWTIQTNQGTVASSRLAVSAGPWTAELIPVLGPFLRVVRKVLLWYPDNAAGHQIPGGPVFLYELPQGVFYGFPPDDTGSIKVARHTGGDSISNPLEVDRALHPTDHESVSDFVKTWHGRISEGNPLKHAVCMYTLSPDLHFVLGSTAPGLAVAAGLSGHGFKFVPALGQALADIAMDDGTQLPIDFLTPARLLV